MLLFAIEPRGPTLYRRAAETKICVWSNCRLRHVNHMVHDVLLSDWLVYIDFHLIVSLLLYFIHRYFVITYRSMFLSLTMFVEWYLI